ncbi:MAG: hypothetical protein LBB07_00880, partial [Bifidobacteriaceae bacterium]|nr:hypothetical protein [Bifidobacteriaceae bacterium]
MEKSARPTFSRTALFLFAALFALAIIFLSSIFASGPDPEIEKSKIENSIDKNSVKNNEIFDNANATNFVSKPNGLTEAEKQRIANEPVGSLEDGTRSIIVNLKEISADDLRAANSKISSAQIEKTLNFDSDNGPEIDSYYKNAILHKQNALLKELPKKHAKLVRKLQVTPTVFFLVDKAGLDAVHKSKLVSSVEDDHLVFAADVPLSPDPIVSMGGTSANGFSFSGQNFNGSGYAVAVLDTGVDRL